MACDRRADAEKKRRQRAKARNKLFDEAFTKIADVEDIHACRELLEQLAVDLGGHRDWQQLAELWAGLLADPKTSKARKITALRTVFYARLLADQAEIEAMRLQQPDFATLDHAAYAVWLAEQGKLPGLVRAALADGLLTWDQIDPPPGGFSEE